jgi:hypothetical protein
MVAASLVAAIALATSNAALAHGTPAISLLAVGLLAAILSAVRDELVLRGVVLRASRGLLPTWAGVLACAGAAAAARLGEDGALGIALGVDALRGLALGALWARDRGAWMAVGANSAFAWTLGSVLRGGLVDVRFATLPEAGMPALLGLGAAGVAACVWAGRAPSPTAASLPRFD